MEGFRGEVRGTLSSNGTKTAMEKAGRPRHGGVGYVVAGMCAYWVMIDDVVIGPW